MCVRPLSKQTVFSGGALADVDKDMCLGQCEHGLFKGQKGKMKRLQDVSRHFLACVHM